MRPDRSALGVPFGADGPWLAAILGVLDELHELLGQRLPVADGPMRVSEPAPDQGPERAVPVSEPPQDEPPQDDEPVRVTEPAPDPPPRAGRGASAEAWRAWANSLAVAIPDGAGRDDIIAACEQAGVLPA